MRILSPIFATVVLTNLAWTQGSPGALDVGTNAVMRVPRDTSLEPFGPFTLEMWIKARGSNSHGRIVRKADDFSPGYLLNFSFQGNRMSGEIVEPGLRATWVTDPSPNSNYLGNWHHIAWSAAPGGQQLLYVDGLLIATAACPQSFVHTGDFVVGGAAFDPNRIGEEFDGMIDELRFWNVERTAAEIDQNRFRRLSSGPGLVSAWHFDGHFEDAVGSNDGESWGARIVPSDAPVSRFFDMSRDRGAWSGGDVVELRGNFPSSALPVAVRFGTDASPSVSVIDPERLAVEVPAGKAGQAVTVQVEYTEFTMNGTSTYAYLPRLLAPPTTTAPSVLSLRVELPPPGQMILFAGAPPAISVAAPPFDGNLQVLPPLLVLWTGGVPFSAVEWTLEIPDDPGLVGAEVLFQGFFLRGIGDGTFTNLHTLRVVP